MFTYTIRELKLLMLSLTLLIFPTINSIFYLNTNKFYSNYIYSKTIPINSHEYINIKDDKENNLQVNNIKEKNNTQTTDGVVFRKAGDSFLFERRTKLCMQ